MSTGKIARLSLYGVTDNTPEEELPMSCQVIKDDVTATSLPSVKIDVLYLIILTYESFNILMPASR